MGKIYEALQEARKNRTKLQVVTGMPEAVPFPREEAPASGPELREAALAPAAPEPREAVSAPAAPGPPETAPAPKPEVPPREEPPTLSVFRPVPAAVPEEAFISLTLDLEAEKEMATLYQNIEALVGQDERKIIQFIGSQPGEGTSTIARDFARFSAARLGKKVLFLEGDPANPRPPAFWGNPADYSLEEAVRQGGEIERAFFRDKKSSLTLSLVAREEGPLMNLLKSETQAPFWDSLREAFDLIVIDSPPLSASAAGLAFCRRADGVVLVLEADRTRGPVAENAKDQILKNGGNILGIVFNKRKFYIPKSIYKRL
jgi:protein-tyrosine kinase